MTPEERDRLARLEVRFDSVLDHLTRLETSLQENTYEIRTLSRQSAWVRGGLVFAISIGGLVAWIPGVVKSITEIFRL